MPTDQKRSPMMQQYAQAKSACGDAILLFRMGDFYELFYEDAQTAARILGLTLTSRDKGEKAIPMAGFPHHQLDSYLAKLIQQGIRVAVCDQVEDPGTAKGLVKREVTRIVSPGTVTDLELLDPRESNFLLAICPTDQAKTKSKTTNLLGISWMDLSTGGFFAATIGRAELVDFFVRLSPSEVLLSDESSFELANAGQQAIVTRRPAWSFATKHAPELLLRHFHVSNLDGFGFVESTDALAIRAAGAIFDYVRENQSDALDYVDRLQPVAANSTMQIDQATWRSLEITRTIRNNERDGSLFDVIDETKTSMGARLLAAWLREPLTARTSIELRQDAVAEFIEQSELRASIRDYLRNVFDLQRLLSRVTSGRTTPRDLSNIASTLAALPSLKTKLVGRSSQWLCQLENDLDLCDQLRDQLEKSLQSECPIAAKEGGFIRPGFNSQLDEYRQLAKGGKAWIANYQRKVSDESGISSLKVGFNKVFGYYIEVTNVHREKVPEHFLRKQTLKNAERYITPELKEYEEKVLTADEKAIELEYEIFCDLRNEVQRHIRRLKRNAEIMATLDVLTGLAHLASTQRYCRPSIVDDATVIIQGGRHPVLDITEPLGSFVPNDTRLGEDDGIIHLITGPNMAGKSTYIRQVALIVLMSHVGSFVPAESATIGITDRLFARVGASDELSRGQSTFMVEMTETARILNTATSRSLIILDEIGRGTSTYDGVSLAWAIVEYIHEQMGSRTMFATHYHELTKLEESFGGVRNYNVAVKEWEDDIVFLHKITPGGADRSYGIHVARLAGVPHWVNHRAEKILGRLEGDPSQTVDLHSAVSKPGSDIQLTLFDAAPHPLIEKIRRLDTNHVSPMTALEIIQQWQTELATDNDSATNVRPDT